MSGIQATRPMNAALRELREADPVKARAVDDAIKHIPLGAEPVRIDVPGGPPDRQYLAMVPYGRGAPVVIYRRLEPDDGADGDWLVTTLIERDKYDEYQRAEQKGILDAPVVKEMAMSVAGTVSALTAKVRNGPIGQRGQQPGSP